MNLLDLDKQLEREQLEEKWNTGRYGIWARLANGQLHPATGYTFHSNNLTKIISVCESLRKHFGHDPRSHSDYVVCDEEDKLKVVYPE